MSDSNDQYELGAQIFIGGPLPRSDQGDREYYCTTMLTLFKPWRTRKDLKSEGQSWDDSFNDFAFDERQIEVMKFFNLRYECLDTRDNFHAELKKGNINDNTFSNTWQTQKNMI